MQNKVVVHDKVDKINSKKFKVKKDKESESDVTIEITADGDYEVDKLSVVGLDATMHDGNPIRWFNNFAIRKKGGDYINQQYFVTIPNPGSSRVVIFDGNGDPYYYTGQIKNNTIELTDGDPAIGACP